MMAIMKKQGKSDRKGRKNKDRRQRAPNNKESGDRPSSRLNAALLYAKAGLAVVPLHGLKDGSCTCRDEHCKQPGNHPRTANGLQDATTNSTKIKRMWSRWPKAKIAVAFGSGVTGVVVEGKAGREALKKLENEK